ncbi:unnamed protein product [Durusdinium trenchii]|uniref:Aspartate carbamoyltransferase regulatory subunit N-terminal domain-containing protein n=2 Tax=Durusdinium trenchii TaxID=1381693 RepID=A0ABP0S0W1_9DINO
MVFHLIIAGRDTTAGLLSFMAYELARNPEVQEKLHQEIMQKLPPQSSLDWKSLSATDMPYLNGVIYETLRLWPPVPLDPKMAFEDDVVPGGFTIPKWSTIAYVPYAMGRDATRYPEPLAFRPERWIPFTPPAHHEFPVFQAGPRICLGMDMALFEAKTITVELLRFLRFEMVEGFCAVWFGSAPDGEIGFDLFKAKRVEIPGRETNGVSFREEWVHQLPKGVRFFQTLPRDKESPIIPLALDPGPINGWDTVAANAYYLDVVLLSMLFGKIGRELSPPDELGLCTSVEVSAPKFAFSSKDLPSFIKEVDLDKDAHQRDPERARAGGPVPIKDGCVLDHLGLGPTSSKCWEALRKVRTILGWSKQVGSEGVYSSKGNPGYFKGILTLPGFDYKSLRVEEMKMMASVAPGCTFNCVNDSKVVAKYRLQVPERIYNLPNISCKNSLCVSNPVNRQREIVAYLERVPYYVSSVLPNCTESEYLYVCKWCRWPHVYENIWDDLRRPGESTR